MADDKWVLRASLELCGAAMPPAYADLNTDAHLNTFDVTDSGGAVLLGANGRLHFVNLFFQPAGGKSASTKPTAKPVAAKGATQMLTHVTLDPPLLPAEVAAVELVQLNASGSHVLLAAKTWVKVVKLPAASAIPPRRNAVLSSSSSRKHSLRGDADAAVARYRVRFDDGAEMEVVLPAVEADATAEDELERVKSDVARRGVRRHVALVSKELGVAPVRQVGYFPGVRQAAWHPLSDAHVVVLSDAEEIALFNLHLDVSKPEQRHSLEFPALSASVSSTSARGSVASSTAFCFGAPSPQHLSSPHQTHVRLWDALTCFILRSDGSIYALCPLVPYDCRVSRSLLQSLRTEVDAHITRCKRQLAASAPRDHPTIHARIAELKSHKYWLQEAWAPAASTDQSSGSADIGSGSSSRHHDHDHDDESAVFKFLKPHVSGISPDTWPLAVQGPVDVTPKSVVAGKNMGAGGSSATSLLAVPHAPRGGDKRPTWRAPFLVRSYTSGHVELVLLDAPILPRWKSELRASKQASSVLPGLLLECLNLGIDDSGGKAVLTRDAADPRLVYCLHSTGVHVLNVSWVFALAAGKQFTSLPKSSVRHIFSVSPAKSAGSPASASAVSNVIGARVSKNVNFGHLMLLRLASGNFEVVNVSAASSELLKGSLVDGESADELAGEALTITLPNTLASMASSKTRTSTAARGSTATAAGNGIRPFADIVEEKLEVLSARGTRVTGSTKLAEVDAAVLAFVIERVKILYEDVDYVNAIDQLLHNRLEVHREMVGAEMEKSLAVKKNVDAAKQSLEVLQSKMQRALAVQQNLSKRAAAMLQAVKENQPNLSRAERDYKSELERLAIEVRRMQPRVTQLTVSGQRLVHSLESVAESTPASRRFSRRVSLDSSDIGSKANVVLSDDKKRMCYDVLQAETKMIDETKSLLVELSANLQQLQQ